MKFYCYTAFYYDQDFGIIPNFCSIICAEVVANVYYNIDYGCNYEFNLNVITKACLSENGHSDFFNNFVSPIDLKELMLITDSREKVLRIWELAIVNFKQKP